MHLCLRKCLRGTRPKVIWKLRKGRSTCCDDQIERKGIVWVVIRYIKVWFWESNQIVCVECDGSCSICLVLFEAKDVMCIHECR